MARRKPSSRAHVYHYEPSEPCRRRPCARRRGESGASRATADAPDVHKTRTDTHNDIWKWPVSGRAGFSLSPVRLVDAVVGSAVGPRKWPFAAAPRERKRSASEVWVGALRAEKKARSGARVCVWAEGKDAVIAAHLVARRGAPKAIQDRAGNRASAEHNKQTRRTVAARRGGNTAARGSLVVPPPWVPQC